MRPRLQVPMKYWPEVLLREMPCVSREKWRQVAQVTVRGCGCGLGSGFMGLDIAEGVVDG